MTFRSRKAFARLRSVMIRRRLSTTSAFIVVPSREASLRASSNRESGISTVVFIRQAVSCSIASCQTQLSAWTPERLPSPTQTVRADCESEESKVQRQKFALHAAHDRGETGGDRGSREPVFGKKSREFSRHTRFCPPSRNQKSRVSSASWRDG